MLGHAICHTPFYVLFYSMTAGSLSSKVHFQEARKSGSVWQLLDGIKESELKNDAFPDILYELVGEKLPAGCPYACFLFFGQYDVPVKGSDKEWLEGSEEVFTYLLCTVGPLEGEYEPGKPEF